MKDYSLDKEQSKHYIKDFRTVKTENGDEYEIIFGEAFERRRVKHVLLELNAVAAPVRPGEVN